MKNRTEWKNKVSAPPLTSSGAHLIIDLEPQFPQMYDGDKMVMTFKRLLTQVYTLENLENAGLFVSARIL